MTTAYYLLSAETTFSAAHTLPGVPQCERMHGHNWRVRATVRLDAMDLDRQGMGVDFRAIEGLLRDATRDFDHVYLNDLATFAHRPPTAECVARVVSERIAARLPAVAPAAKIVEVTLWELPQYRVVYRPG